MKTKLLSTLLITITLSLFGQTANAQDCYEIKYLDFFGLYDYEPIKWSKADLSGLLATDFEEDRNGSAIKTSFLIPAIVSQLKDYHPNCNLDIDTEYFKQLSNIYFNIRGIEPTQLANKSTAETIDFMTADFYTQVNDEQYLPRMIMSFDDGPFYGQAFKQALTTKPIQIQKTNFGQLSIYKLQDQSILISKNKNGEIIWQKSMTGLQDNNLSDLSFKKSPMQYTSLATIAYLSADGERLTLYLKSDGSFMFYTHSW